MHIFYSTDFPGFQNNNNSNNLISKTPHCIHHVNKVDYHNGSARTSFAKHLGLNV